MTLNDADKVKKRPVALQNSQNMYNIYIYIYNINIYKKKGKMMAHPPPHTRSVLSIFPFKMPILGRRLAKTALLLSLLCSFNRNVCF